LVGIGEWLGVTRPGPQFGDDPPDGQADRHPPAAPARNRKPAFMIEKVPPTTTPTATL
jgi:hypothetical protein